MKRSFLIIAAIVIASFLLAIFTYAEVPRLIRFQGKVTDTEGAPLNGSYNITFRVYDVQTGGAPIWFERQPAIPVNNGIFTVLLGNVTNLNLPFDAPYWLSMEVSDDGEMSPRQQITSVGYAIRAEVADSISNVTLMPSGAIILWRDPKKDGKCPEGYTRVSELDNKFLVSGATYNAAAGGSNTHDHGGVTGSHTLTVAEMPSHNHTGTIRNSNGYNGSSNIIQGSSPSGATATFTSSSTGGRGGHNHPMSSSDNRPEFATILLCGKD